MMHEQASKLMESYFAGETSLAEEQQLKKYFAAGYVRPELQPYAPLFDFWKCENEVAVPPESKLRALPKAATKLRKIPRALLAIAAALLLLLVVRYNKQNTPNLTDFPVAERQPVDWSKYEITDEKEALKFLKTTLKTASDQLTAGPALTIQELREFN